MGILGVSKNNAKRWKGIYKHKPTNKIQKLETLIDDINFSKLVPAEEAEDSEVVVENADIGGEDYIK